MNFYPYFRYFLTAVGELRYRRSLRNAVKQLNATYKLAQRRPCCTEGRIRNFTYILHISRVVLKKFGIGIICSM